MTKEQLPQEEQTQEQEVQENPLEKLTIEELETSLVDSEQIVKNTKAELKANTKIAELAEQIKAHRGDPKWNEHKEKIASIKEKLDDLKSEQKELQAEIDEDIAEQIAEKSQLEAPYRETIKGHTANIKQVVDVLEDKGRVVQIPEEDKEEN